ncbi:MAG: VanW family protein, partial [bacterium]|nr:VanW family protein [bacterium]
LLILEIILVAFSLYHLAFYNRTLPGLYVGNISFSGLNKVEVEEKLQSIDKVSKTKWNLEVGDNTYLVEASDIGYKFNSDAVETELFLLGREKNILTSFKIKFLSLAGGYHLKPVYNIDSEKYDQFINNVVENATFPYVNAKYSLDENQKLVIVPDQNGYTISKDLVDSAIESKYYNFNSNSKVTVDIEVVNSEVSATLLALNFDQVSEFINRDFKMSYQDRLWVATKKEKLEIFIFSDVARVDLDQVLIKEILDFVNNPKKVEVFKVEDGKVTEFVPASDGVEVDQILFAKLLEEAVINPEITTINIPVKTSEVEKGNNDYGVEELVGSGETTYFHSAINRVFNVHLAATRVNGILVAPGEIFSFVDTVGEVSAASGYKEGYIIYNNRTILGDGGGLCQVSTTLFRAILDAGLPIVSRSGHAYRVSYYEQNSDPGFDATVYVPSVDLKFKNDTGHYLLIVSESKPDEFYLKYNIYGKSDGRKVTITKPVITSVTPPPDEVRQDDSTLPKGTVKQIEWATWGANVEFSRTVERDGKIIYKELFKTNYTPWANAYLVGTKE